MVVGSFGPHLAFEVQPDKVLAPGRIKRDLSASYEEHKVLGAKPRLEFLAPELHVCSFSVLLSTSLGVDPVDAMLTVETLITGGFVHKLILGGINYGRHVLMKATAEWSRSDAAGKPVSMQVSLEFKEYVYE